MNHGKDQIDLLGLWRKFASDGPRHLRFWVVGLCLGIAAGFAAVGFRLGVSALQRTLYGVDERGILSGAMDLHWGIILGLPVLGGLVVGLVLHRFTDDGRARAVADTIEGAALNLVHDVESGTYHVVVFAQDMHTGDRDICVGPRLLHAEFAVDCVGGFEKHAGRLAAQDVGAVGGFKAVGGV